MSHPPPPLLYLLFSVSARQPVSRTHLHWVLTRLLHQKHTIYFHLAATPAHPVDTQDLVGPARFSHKRRLLHQFPSCSIWSKVYPVNYSAGTPHLTIHMLWNQHINTAAAALLPVIADSLSITLIISEERACDILDTKKSTKTQLHFSRKGAEGV